MLIYKEIDQRYEINGKLLSHFTYRQAEIKYGLFKTYFIITDGIGSHKFEIGKHEVDTAIDIAKQIKRRQKQLLEERKQQQEIEDAKKIKFNVAGTSFKQKELQELVALIVENNSEERFEGYSPKEINDSIREYGQSIFEYKPLGIDCIEFELEPTNEFDKNAIKVMAGIDEKYLYHIGYVPKQIIKEIAEIIHDFDYLDGSIVGGKYKTVNQDDKIITKNSDYKVSLTIKKK